MLYNKTKQLQRFFFFFFSTLHHLLTQTLTTLDLENNQIGPQGAEHLASALQQNKVNTALLLLLLNTSPSSYTDTHHTKPRIQ
jgi:hypothetical protein